MMKGIRASRFEPCRLAGLKNVYMICGSVNFGDDDFASNRQTPRCVQMCKYAFVSEYIYLLASD